ncbi:predicted protein [Plenodomus lingam JN3]|uniref:Predicted protein n=1 Tax=Leptosphaeria maculans (strain JN3 / isolate v23.1.3 / race Av1-4-5-6-7-8) TaxID=985895 RepID=E5R557_LEPMJ|nr:predicted protein [Plenodomus lingam JN3]CBX92027.1 predicted protein [Plenodomus lingam JN3]
MLGKFDSYLTYAERYRRFAYRTTLTIPPYTVPRSQLN